MDNPFCIQPIEGAFLFLSLQEFDAHCKQLKKDNLVEIQNTPEKYPCIGFWVHTESSEYRRDREIYAFVYPHATDEQKQTLWHKSQYEPLDRFECALTACD